MVLQALYPPKACDYSWRNCRLVGYASECSTLLREKVLEMRQRGMSYRQIAEAVGLHWTRVGQILKGSK